jgi:CDP-diglyceride synthetase
MDVDGEAAGGGAENSYRSNAAQESDRCVVLCHAVLCFAVCVLQGLSVLCCALLGFATIFVMGFVVLCNDTIALFV